MEKTINPYNPVYISYAHGDDIEQDVNRICELMQKYGIAYERDKEGLCPTKAYIPDVEQEIGEGDAVIVVVSQKYLQSLHTMNEWNNIVNRGDIANRVFLIMLENAGITNFDTYNQYRNYLKEQHQQCFKKFMHCFNNGIIPYDTLSKIEIQAFLNCGFVSALDRLHSYCVNYNRGANIKILRKTDYQDFIASLKSYVIKISEHPQTQSNISSLKRTIKKLNTLLAEKDTEINLLQDEIINIRRELEDYKNSNAMEMLLTKSPNSIKNEIEDYMWDIAQKTCTSLSLQNYIDVFPNGKYLTVAKTSIAFADQWSKLQKESNIFDVYDCLNSMDKTNLFYEKFESLYKSLRENELENMRRNPSEYTDDKVERLLSAGIFTKPELIDCSSATENSFLRQNYKLLPDINMITTNFAFKEEDNCTDIFLFGIPAVGKTCLLMGLSAASGHGFEISFDPEAGLYSSALRIYAKEGFFPNRTTRNQIPSLTGHIKEIVNGKSITKKFNIAEVSGETFMADIVTNKNGSLIISDMGLNVGQLLRNKNKKCFLILVDGSTNCMTFTDTISGRLRRHVINQDAFIQRFVSLITLPENQDIMKRVDSIHFVVTKADLLADTEEEQFQEAQKILMTEYYPAVSMLKNYCAMTKRINAATNYIPKVFPFSLGKSYNGGQFDYEASYSLKLIKFLSTLIPAQEERTFLDKFVNLIKHS